MFAKIGYSNAMSWLTGPCKWKSNENGRGRGGTPVLRGTITATGF